MKSGNVMPEDLCEVITRFRCIMCDASFSSKEGFQKHISTEHSPVVKSPLLNKGRIIKKKSTRTSFMKNVSKRTKNLAKSLVRNICPSAPSPIKVEGSEDKKLVKELTIVLTRQQFHEIVVTTPNKGSREIYYRGAVELGPTDPNSGPEKKPKLTDWRLETIESIKKTENEDKCVEKKLALDIPVQFSFMFNINGIKDDLHSILDVLTGHKMKTAVLDAYILKLVEEYRSREDRNLDYDFRYLSVHFLPVHERTQNPESFKPSMSFFPNFPITKSCLLIAPLYTCQHFYLAVIDFSCKNVRIYDSCWHFVSFTLRFQQVHKLLQYLIKDEEVSGDEQCWNIMFVQDCCQQVDEFSCGCYVVHFAENELKGEEQNNIVKVERSHVLQMRRKIVSELLPSTRAGGQFLEAISE